jgi:pyruvate ferredoxin oxidoreductase delta subunit
MSWDFTDIQNWTAKDHPSAATIPEAGTAKRYKTGTWRSEKPKWIEEECSHCLICWMFCPDSAILVKDGKMVAIDYDHCKGCGICATECPRDAIVMIAEEK